MAGALIPRFNSTLYTKKGNIGEHIMHLRDLGIIMLERYVVHYVSQTLLAVTLALCWLCCWESWVGGQTIHSSRLGQWQEALTHPLYIYNG